MNYRTKENPKGGTAVPHNPKEESATKKVREHGSSWKIDEALQLLDEAAKEKKEEIGHLMTEKYSNIKEVFHEATRSYTEVIEETKRNISDAVTTGEEKLKEMTTDIDKRVHENPWTFLGIAAVAFFLSGYILSGSIRSEIRYKY